MKRMDHAARLDVHPDTLAYYAFIWTEARLAVSIVALLLGSPPALTLFAFAPAYGFAVLGVKLAWLVSGAVSAYLLYRWYQAQWYVFDKPSTSDIVAFMIAVVSGFNLGLTGLTGVNPGLSIFSGYGFALLGALAYAWAAYHLYLRWQQNGQRLFL